MIKRYVLLLSSLIALAGLANFSLLADYKGGCARLQGCPRKCGGYQPQEAVAEEPEEMSMEEEVTVPEGEMMTQAPEGEGEDILGESATPEEEYTNPEIEESMGFEEENPDESTYFQAEDFDEPMNYEDVDMEQDQDYTNNSDQMSSDED